MYQENPEKKKFLGQAKTLIPTSPQRVYPLPFLRRARESGSFQPFILDGILASDYSPRNVFFT